MNEDNFNIPHSKTRYNESMECNHLIVVSLDEIAGRWQIPAERIQYFIVECGMPVDNEGRGKWFVEHSDLILEEKRKAFEASLFPRHFRPEPAESST